jgi:flagellar biosynthesis protein FlhB
MSEKTEDATPKRLRKAREEGDSGSSAFAAQSIAFLVAVALLPAAIHALVERSASSLREVLVRAPAGGVAFDASELGGEVLTLALPVLLAAGIAGGVGQVVQTGGFVSMGRLSPKLDKLNVFEGIKNLFSTQKLTAVVRAMVSGSVVAWLAYRGLKSHLIDVAHLTGRLQYVGTVASEIARKVAIDAAVVGLALGALDMLVVRRAWRKRLMMSKDEVKREYKESEGDPQTKAARERAHHEMLASATVGNVKNATVVVVNPTHLATALKYDEKDGDEAPVVVAMGEGELAQRIIAAARDYGVPVLRDVPLARALAELQIGDAIPEALYEAVAEILREAWAEDERPPKQG